jgi:hypothetical protein
VRSFADLVHALSWRIAAEIASCVPQSFIVEIHPSGAADVLSVRQWGREEVASIDRFGALRAGDFQLTWADVVRLGTAGTAAQLLKGIRQSTRRRPTNSPRRTYRMLAEVLEIRLPDDQSWQVRSAMLDSESHGVHLQRPLLMDVAELFALDPYQVWTVLRDGVPVLAMSDGTAYFPDGQRMTLMEVASDDERSAAGYILRRITGE